MTTPTKPTTRRWRVEQNAYGRVFIMSVDKPNATGAGFAYSDLVAGGNSHDTLTLASAALIVRAVNAFDPMREALLLAHGMLSGLIGDWQGDGGDLVKGMISSTNDAVLAALAKATGDE